MSDRQRPLAAIAIAVLVLAAVAVGPALAQSGEPSDTALTLSADIPINTDGSVATFERDGVVDAEIDAPRMSITIGEKREHVGLGYTPNPLKGSTRNDFIRITHREGMERTIQVPIRADYWNPFPRDELDSISESHTASLEPVKIDGTRYTLITVTFNGEGSAVFPVPGDAAGVYTAMERTENRTNRTFGLDLGLTPTPWSTVPSEVFGNKTAVRIEGNPDKMMIQYNAGTASEPEWLTVPDSQTRTDPLYRMEKDGVDNAVYVVSKTEDPPAVRYKQQSSMGDRVSEWTREARHLLPRILDGVGVDLPFFSTITGVEYAH